jgi:hypothetical protein
MSVPPIFSIFCIDYRYDSLNTQYFKELGIEFNYYMSTTAGAALALGYESYCDKICNGKCKKKLCDPKNADMHLLKDGLKKNLEIALSLSPITEVYLVNHQDCGAFKAFLACSGYPKTLGGDNQKEIQINTCIMIYAYNYIKKKFPKIKTIRLGLIDTNGSVADLNIKTNVWNVVFTGVGVNPLGLWYGKPIETAPNTNTWYKSLLSMVL